MSSSVSIKLKNLTRKISDESADYDSPDSKRKLIYSFV